MNRDQKAAVIEEVARQIDAADAVFAIDYRGISVKQSADLRVRLDEAGASFRVIKNRLGQRAVDRAGADGLKALLEGPTALTFVRGDAATVARALAAFRREHGRLVFKGGTLNGDALSADDVEAISRLPSRDALYGQLAGVTASPLSGLVRGLAGLISGLGSQLRQMEEQGLVGGGAAPAPGSPDEGETASEPPEPAPTPAAEAPGDPVAEAATAEEEQQAPAEGVEANQE
ncbi:MAG TPA: 50S ribosomal protein L10 [Thermoleophilaceae bacterium]|nr:50S ribosomal protein L10 [Thermoleophilaceae bacterium]